MEQTANLTEELSTVARLLSAAGESRWHKYIADCRTRIAAGNYSGVEKLLWAYGDMGSLNDVQGASDSDHALLQSALSRSYDIAVLIRRSREQGDTKQFIQADPAPRGGLIQALACLGSPYAV